MPKSLWPYLVRNRFGPLLVLGDVSLILFCRTAVASAPDARALIALARQVSISLENAALREAAKRAASPVAVV